MKIVDAALHVVATEWRNLTIVHLLTDDGIDGVGEVRMVNHTQSLLGMLEEIIPRHVIGRDPQDIEDLVNSVTQLDYARPGEVLMSGLAAVEIACWDMIGKSLKTPVYKLLGGAVRDRIKAYANGWYRVQRSPEAFHAAARTVVESGYIALKLDPFGPGRTELRAAESGRALALVEAVRDAIGPDCELMIEMHGRFSAATAIRLARDLERFNPEWIEEPVPAGNAKALAKVAAHSRIPVASGERIHDRKEYREYFELQAIDIAQPDVTQFGGIWESKKLAAEAEVRGVLIAPHNVGGSISTAANLHLAASTTNFKIQEYFNDFADPDIADVAPGLPDMIDGHFQLPDAPGLGVVLNEEKLKEFPRQNVTFDLFKEGWELRNLPGS
jgi:galactonate dehydratase